MTDNVNHPAHYEANGPFECIELTQHFNFCIGNAIKYVWRHMDKGKPFEDLSKALWYVQWEMDSTYSSDYHTPIPTYRKLCELVDSDFANMADFWNAIYEGNLIDAKQEIQTRAKKLVADYPTHVILTHETMPNTPPELQPTRLVNTMSQGHRLRELRKHRNMTRAQTVTNMRERGFPWTDNTIGNLEAGNRRISLNEAIALMETYGYIGANMFPTINYILENPHDKQYARITNKK